MNQDNHIIKNAKQDLFDFLDFQKVCLEIQKEIIINYRKDTQFHGLLIFDYIQKIRKSPPDEQEKIAHQFSRLTQKQIRSIVQGTKQIINKINEELDCFSMQVSTQGQYMIYLIAQTYLNSLAGILEMIYENQPLKQLESRKKAEKDSFIAKLTQNITGMDKTLAKKIANDMIEFYLRKAKNFSISEFKDNMNSQKNNFIKLAIFNDLENQCQDLADKRIKNTHYQLSSNDNNLIQKACEFYKEPKDFLDKLFAQKFQDTSKEFLLKSQTIFSQKFKEGIQSLYNFLEDFKVQLEKKNVNLYSNIMFSFQNVEFNDINNLNTKYQKKAAAKYFCEIISKNWENNKKIQIDDKILHQNPDYQLPIPYDLKTNLDELSRDQFQKFFNKDDELNNISYFLAEFMNNLKIKLDQLNPKSQKYKELSLEEQKKNQLSELEIIGDFMIKFRMEFIGCREHCPLCRRQCDIQHDIAIDLIKHDCSSGHQIQGFGGCMIQDDKKALTISCNEIQNNDMINYKENQQKWIVFKESNILKNWNFDNNKKEQAIQKDKNVKIWNLIGTKICEMYQKDGIPIIYQIASLQRPFQIKKTHFILMLDSSGSMGGQPWSQLISCVSNFFKQLESNPSIRDNVKVSVIVYSSVSNIIISQQIPSLALVKKIQYTGGGTNFSCPLQNAFQLYQLSHSQFDKIVLYFLSDGQADYPSAQVNQLAKFEQEKIEFQAVGFGQTNFLVLTQISQAFKNGKMTTALNYESLNETFIKIIPNIYGE